MQWCALVHELLWFESGKKWRLRSFSIGLNQVRLDSWWHISKRGLIHMGCLFSVDGAKVLQNAEIRTFTTSHFGAHIFCIKLVIFQQLWGKYSNIKCVSSLTKKSCISGASRINQHPYLLSLNAFFTTKLIDFKYILTLGLLLQGQFLQKKLHNKNRWDALDRRRRWWW